MWFVPPVAICTDIFHNFKALMLKDQEVPLQILWWFEKCHNIPGAHGINQTQSLGEAEWVDVHRSDGKLIHVHQEWWNAASNSYFCLVNKLQIYVGNKKYIKVKSSSFFEQLSA